MHPFSKRYNIDLLEIETLSEENMFKLKHRLCELFCDFNEESLVRPSRYNSNFTIQQDMFVFVREKIIERDNIYPNDDFPEIILDYYWNRNFIEIFDMIEFWYNGLSIGEKLDYQHAINKVFKSMDFPWRLADGYIIKIDNSLVQQEIIPEAVQLMEKNGFAGALQEFAQAQNDLTARDYRSAILNACRSVESTLKIALNEKKRNMRDLVIKATSQGMFEELPLEVEKGFGDNVFMSLAFMRNRLTGHGQGSDILTISEDYATLAVNLAAVYNTFFMNKLNNFYHNQEQNDLQD